MLSTLRNTLTFIKYSSCSRSSQFSLRIKQIQGLPKWLSGRESAYQCRRLSSMPGSDPWVRKFLCRRKWQPTPVLLPGKSHGQRSLVSYSPQSQRIKHCLVTKQQQQQTHISVKRRFMSRHLRAYRNRNKVLDNG